MPAIGFRCNRIVISSRDISRQLVSSVAMGVGLMCGLLQHGSEAEELAVAGFIHNDFLIVFIDRGNTHGS